MKTKLCIKCGEIKPLSEFNRKKRIKDGYNYWCKECCHKYYEQYYVRKTPEKPKCSDGYKYCTGCKKIKPLSEFSKNKSRKDGCQRWCKKCKKEYSKKYYEDNKEIIKKQHKKYREDNKDYFKEYNKNWQKENIEKYPWYISYNAARQRCNNPNASNYKRYGGKGIAFKMTLDDFKYLWFRDKAYELDRPSIDRKDSDGNYELSNCRFIELIENSGRNNKRNSKI